MAKVAMRDIEIGIDNSLTDEKAVQKIFAEQNKTIKDILEKRAGMTLDFNSQQLAKLIQTISPKKIFKRKY
ncbi:MAG: hypothetical protein WC356_05640 [Candidatus Micrarchaeia archaeon]|jgi:hypothetical protein